MTHRGSVWCIGSGVVAALVAWAGLAGGDQATPFCGFSAHGGWRGHGSVKFIDVRKPRDDDRTGVPQAVRSILGSLAIEVPIDVYLTKTKQDNAFATVAGGRKIMVIDPGFLQHVNTKSNNDWAAIQVLAHEVGHHIAGFDTDRHRGELNADYWSGQVLQRLGAAREATTAAIKATVPDDTDSPTHPGRSRREQAIVRGWDDALANHIDHSFCLTCK
jgi:hypothetical protein